MENSDRQTTARAASQDGLRKDTTRRTRKLPQAPEISQYLSDLQNRVYNATHRRVSCQIVQPCITFTDVFIELPQTLSAWQQSCVTTDQQITTSFCEPIKNIIRQMCKNFIKKIKQEYMLYNALRSSFRHAVRYLSGLKCASASGVIDTSGKYGTFKM